MAICRILGFQFPLIVDKSDFSSNQTCNLSDPMPGAVSSLYGCVLPSPNVVLIAPHDKSNAQLPTLNSSSSAPYRDIATVDNIVESVNLFPKVRLCLQTLINIATFVVMWVTTFEETLKTRFVAI